MKRLIFLLLITSISASAQQRRNPFQYVERPPKREPIRVTPPAPAPQPVIAPLPVAAPAQPVAPPPPSFPWRFIGLFGYADNPIVAFATDDRVITVQSGDTIDGAFVVRSIGIGSVEIGFVNHPSTLRLQLDGWL